MLHSHCDCYTTKLLKVSSWFLALQILVTPVVSGIPSPYTPYTVNLLLAEAELSFIIICILNYNELIVKRVSLCQIFLTVYI